MKKILLYVTLLFLLGCNDKPVLPNNFYDKFYNVFPNPFIYNTRVWINSEVPNQIYKISIFDEKYKLMESAEITGNGSFSPNLYDKKSGVYHLEIETNGQKIKDKLFKIEKWKGI
jgi:hypothetical protein